MKESADVTTLVDRTGKASAAWQRLRPGARAAYVRRLRHAIEESQHGLAAVISSETDRPVTDVLLQEVTASLGMLHFIEKNYPRWLEGRRFRDVKPGFWTKSNRVAFDPIGTIAVIAPSNFPFSIAVMQTCAALVCGNTVVLKPSEKCPDVSGALRRLFEEGLLPPGVVTIVEGGPAVAAELISKETVSKVLFTGSTDSGRAVARLCGMHFKPCVLELGGDGPAIVCADADLRLAARGIVWSAMYAAGRSCIGTRRVFADRRISQRLETLILEEYEMLHVGSPDENGIDVPQDRSLRILRSGPGGDLRSDPREPSTADATDYEHVADFSNDAEMLLEWYEFDDVDAAVGHINASEAGLSASIWSSNLPDARIIASELRVGMVWINDASVAQPAFSWGGVRGSGWGRLFSREALTELTHVKTISVERRWSARPKIWWFPYSPEKYDLTAAVNSFLFGRSRWSAAGRLLRALFAYLRR